MDGVQGLTGKCSADKKDRSMDLQVPGKGTVLIVEDNSVLRRVLAAIFKKIQWRTTEVGNGSEAIDILKAESFDLVVMDVMMPIMDGREATRHIRQTLQSDIPIIGLTGHSHTVEHQMCLDAGMNACLVKPVDLNQLYQTIKSVMKEPGTLSETGSGYSVDHSVIQTAWESHAGLMSEFRDQFLAEYKDELEIIREGIARGNFLEVEVAAHSFKSVLGIFYAQKAFRLAAEIEQLAKLDALPEAVAVLKELEIEIECVRTSLLAM